MKLYLSSFLLGNQPQELVRLAGGPGAITAVITNAGDQWPDQEAHNSEIVRELRELGLDAHQLDLRDYFGAVEDLRPKLNACQAVWARGGNSFLLLRAMLQSGFDEVALPLIESNKLAYGGYSAGVCAITPTLRGLEFVDFPYEVPAGYDAAVPWDGMGLLDYAVAPHYRSNHPESRAIEEVVSYYQKHKIPYKALRDGEVIIVDTPRSISVEI